MKKILFLLFLLISTPAYAVFKAEIPGLDQTGVSNSADITVVCDSGNTFVSSGAGVWACGSAGGGSTPSGTGFVHINAGNQDAAARAVNLASADVTGTLAVGNGGTGQTTVTAAFNALGTMDGTPDSDHTANGQSTATFNAGDTITVMDLVFMGPAGTWLKTDADLAASSDSVLAISLESKTASQAMSVALSGSFVRDDTWNWTVGDTIYIDTITQGGLTATQPSGTDDVVRVVGFAVTADVIYFAPSEDYFTHT